jgi:uncharacterized membrane protein YesL
MGSFFRIYGGLFTGLGKVFDIMLVSLLWFICCLPIVTIGPATTALYYTVVKTIRRERGYVSKEFFHSFRLNLKQGMISGIMLTVFAVLMLVNFQLVKAIKSNISTILFGIYLSMTIIVFLTSVYVFPNLSRFTLTVKGLFKNSFAMAIRHFPSSILIGVIVLACVFGMYIMPIAIFFLPGLGTLLTSFLMEKILKKYTPETDADTEAWYMQ